MARKSSRSRKAGPVVWEPAPDIAERVDRIAQALDLQWLKTERVKCFRSRNTSTRAYARTWGFPRILQLALNEPPAYVIEVVSEKFDKLGKATQDEILLHELAHIPRNFSGALVAHTHHGKGSFHDKLKTMLIAYRRSGR